MPFLIDTDHLIDWLENRRESLQLFESMYEEGIAISIITYMEAFEGVLREEASTGAPSRLRRRIDGIRIMELSPRVARRCAEIRLALRRAGKQPNRRPLDLIIAATAIEYGLTLVTRNVSDYRDIPGIELHV